MGPQIRSQLRIPAQRRQQGIRLAERRLGLVVIEGKLGLQPEQADAQLLGHAGRAARQQLLDATGGFARLAELLHFLHQVPLRLPAAQRVKPGIRRRLVELPGGRIEPVGPDLRERPLENQHAGRRCQRRLVQRGLIGIRRVAIILGAEERLGQQHAQLRPFPPRREHATQEHDDVGRRAVTFQIPRHRQPHPQRRSLQRRARITLDQGARILLGRGVKLVGQRRLGPHQQQVLDDRVLRRRHDELGEIAPQLLALHRRLRPAHEKLERDALGFGLLRIAQQLPERLPAGLAARAGDQAEHQAKLVGDIALGTRDDRQLAVDHGLRLGRAIQGRQRRGIGACRVVTRARALETVEVAAQGRHLLLGELSAAQQSLLLAKQETRLLQLRRGRADCLFIKGVGPGEIRLGVRDLGLQEVPPAAIRRPQLLEFAAGQRGLGRGHPPRRDRQQSRAQLIRAVPRAGIILQRLFRRRGITAVHLRRDQRKLQPVAGFHRQVRITQQITIKTGRRGRKSVLQRLVRALFRHDPTARHGLLGGALRGQRTRPRHLRTELRHGETKQENQGAHRQLHGRGIVQSAPPAGKRRLLQSCRHAITENSSRHRPASDKSIAS